MAGYEGQKCLLYTPWKGSRVCFLAASGNPVARRYDGTNWQEYPLLGVRQAIVAVEAHDGDVWIQGMYGDLAQFNGLSFLPVLGPDGEKTLQDVGPAGVWMSMAGELYHRTGWTWTRTELPNGPLTVFGVAGRSATEAWMVGNRAGQPYVARWDGTAWTEVAAPPPGGLLWDVEIGTGSDIWVTTSRKELAHWNGTEWTVLPAPAAGTLNSFKVDSNGVPWLLYGNVLYSYVNGAFTLRTLQTDRAWRIASLGEALVERNTCMAEKPAVLRGLLSLQCCPSRNDPSADFDEFDGSGQQVIADLRPVRPAR